MRRSILVSLGLALATAGSLAAQAPGKGAVEIGVFGRYSMYPDALVIPTDGAIGFGGRFGLHFSGKLGLEADYSSTKADTKADATQYVRDNPLHIRFTLTPGKLILGAGYTKMSFKPSVGATTNHASGLGLLLGLQQRLGGSLMFRVEGTYDKFGTGSAFGTKSGAVMGIDFGLGLVLGGHHRAAVSDMDHDGVPDTADACPGTAMGTQVDARGCTIVRDADHDGVADASDACPATAAGERVDARGCPLPKDADSDGVTDNMDRCAGTPAGTPVDANGCPRDTDGDGVSDNNDKCAGTVAGTPVDATGCPKDTDGDGVTDNNDHCAGTPAGTKVDATGCPLPDTDGDGVVDRDDKCAATPASIKVDANGCQMLFDTTAGQTAVVLQGVNFRPGSSALTPASLPILDRVAAALVANPAIKVEVQGHTDNSGGAAANRAISQRRANRVRLYLIGKGVDGSRLTAKGYGPDQPKVPNTSAANRAQNRRVELKMVP